MSGGGAGENRQYSHATTDSDFGIIQLLKPKTADL
jgi:hypothetical protein